MQASTPLRVLIAEDDFLVSKEIERATKSAGYTIAGIASNGKRAIEMTARLKPDVVLMDIHMPEMNGLEAARILQEQHPTPVVVLTAHESYDLVEKASKTGVGSYLTKPPSSMQIERAVIIACARHKDLMEMQELNIRVRKQKEDLEKAMSELKILRGILPICVSCKKIRDDGGYWKQVEEYIGSRSEAVFSHGICPDCSIKLYGYDAEKGQYVRGARKGRQQRD
ncbi:MAG: response regulator [Chitinivibrionales bacterium]|nr:response regulator [Chitinivibrionales bacterium]